MRGRGLISLEGAIGRWGQPALRVRRHQLFASFAERNVVGERVERQLDGRAGLGLIDLAPPEREAHRGEDVERYANDEMRPMLLDPDKRVHDVPLGGVMSGRRNGPEQSASERERQSTAKHP